MASRGIGNIIILFLCHPHYLLKIYDDTRKERIIIEKSVLEIVRKEQRIHKPDRYNPNIKQFNEK